MVPRTHILWSLIRAVGHIVIFRRCFTKLHEERAIDKYELHSAAGFEAAALPSRGT